MASKHRPQRSCVVCREKTDKRDLIRLVFAADSLRIDKTGKMNGRGAYLCRKQECWESAAARPILDKALRRNLNDHDRNVLQQMKPS